MKNSLQEQLLQLGLIDKSKAQQAKKEQRNKTRTASASSNTIAEAVAQAAAEKANRDRELNRQKEQKQETKARKALLRQYIEQNRLNDPKADQHYSFVHNTSVKRLYVTKAQREKLVAGSLAIVHTGERYVLVGLEAAAKIRELSADIFVFIAQPEPQIDSDPYAEFTVPDDLMW